MSADDSRHPSWKSDFSTNLQVKKNIVCFMFRSSISSWGLIHLVYNIITSIAVITFNLVRPLVCFARQLTCSFFVVLFSMGFFLFFRQLKNLSISLNVLNVKVSTLVSKTTVVPLSTVKNSLSVFATQRHKKMLQKQTLIPVTPS